MKITKGMFIINSNKNMNGELVSHVALNVFGKHHTLCNTMKADAVESYVSGICDRFTVYSAPCGEIGFKVI